MTQTYKLERWWRKQPPVGSRVGVLSRTSQGVVLSVRLRRVSSNVLSWSGAAIGLAIYEGRAWPYPSRVRIRALRKKEGGKE